jgi:hypothetical protein
MPQTRDWFRNRHLAVLIVFSGPSLPAFHVQSTVPVLFTHAENLQLLGFASTSCFQIELMGMERTDDPSVSDESFGQRPLLMRASVLGCKKHSVALAEHSDLLIADDIASALPKGDSVDAAKVGEGCDFRFSH